VAYDLPGTANARILWGTGRGNTLRTGSVVPGPRQSWRTRVQPILAGPGDTLTYTIRLENPGPALPNVHVTNTLPTKVHSLGNLWASYGSTGEMGGIITWTGTLPAITPITISFGVTVSEQITTPQPLINTTLWDDGLGNVWQQQVMVIANGYAVYLPMICRH
jgi:uncharacterized repeat protein (TIGR01451 family)